ncbi:hypothetical protein F4811DRAFT_549136 [Daldinia bambusicola]|nr:hypothetical protein F4811DRAFT_549136 [Daldinia bambusicola]
MASPEAQNPQQKYGLSCPLGGSFYVCQSSQIRFLGCCETDPCPNGGQCPVSQLHPVSYDNYPDSHQSCVAPYDKRKWYTCDFATPKFMGCCLQNPCDEGCPNWNLIPAQLDDDESLAEKFLSPPHNNSSNRTGLIAGFSVVGLVLLILSIAAFVCRRKIKNVLGSYMRPRPSAGDQSDSSFTEWQRGRRTPLKPDRSPTSSNGTAHTYKTPGLRLMNPDPLPI